MTVTFAPFLDVGEAWNAIYQYRVGDEGIALADEHKTALDTFLQLDAIALTISQAAEYVFARIADLATSAPGLVALGARAAFLANRLCIDNMGGPRGLGITDALRRESGEETDPRYPWPDPSEDPEPRAEFVPPAESIAAPPDELPLPPDQAVPNGG